MKYYNDLIKDSDVESYIILYISQCILFFYDFNLYSPFNMIYYNKTIAPSLKQIIAFVEMNNMTDIINKTHNIIINTLNKTKKTYFNPISHHIFITPYIYDNMLFKTNKKVNYYGIKPNNIKYIDSLLNVVETCIPGIWYKNESFNLRDIDPNKFINITNNMIDFYQNNFIDRFFINNNMLIGLNK